MLKDFLNYPGNIVTSVWPRKIKIVDELFILLEYNKLITFFSSTFKTMLELCWNEGKVECGLDLKK